MLAPLSALGTALAGLGAVAALGPSLLPRDLPMQCLGCALAAMSYYAIGAVVAAVGRLAGIRPGVRARRASWVVAAAAWVGVLVVLPGRLGWQDEQARSLGLPEPHLLPVAVAVVTLVLLAAMLALGRAVRLLARVLAVALRWFVPAGPTSVLLGGVGAAVAVAAVAGLAYQAAVTVYAATDTNDTGQTPPTSPLRSGGPGSNQPWESLGYEGRAFVSGALTDDQLAMFTDHPTPPIRVYVGLAQAADSDARAQLAVQELDRTGAWDRAALVLTPPVGTGWVDPDAVTSFEAVTGGDVATVSMQYSYLPSWLSFIVDQQASERSATSLYDAVVSAWLARPAATRPALYLFGESLGAFGGQAAFPHDADPEQVVQHASAVVWVGSPGGSNLWPRWRTELRTGGPPYQPVIDGGSVARTALGIADLDPDQPGWGPRRIVLLGHPVDPVVWWSGDLALRYPDWIAEPGPGVDPRLRWWPITTFWSIGLDLAVGGGTPPGVGHNYQPETASAVVAALDPPGWTAVDTARLQRLVDLTRPED